MHTPIAQDMQEKLIVHSLVHQYFVIETSPPAVKERNQ